MKAKGRLVKRIEPSLPPVHCDVDSAQCVYGYACQLSLPLFNPPCCAGGSWQAPVCEVLFHGVVILNSLSFCLSSPCDFSCTLSLSSSVCLFVSVSLFINMHLKVFTTLFTLSPPVPPSKFSPHRRTNTHMLPASGLFTCCLPKYKYKRWICKQRSLIPFLPVCPIRTHTQ